MAYETLGKNSMLDHLGTEITYVGLLDEVDAEITTGVGVYARKAITWGAADAGSMAASNQPVITVPLSTTVSKVILCSAQTAGTTWATADVDNEVFTNEGTYTITSATLDLNA